jgi:hypothetical protein
MEHIGLKETIAALRAELSDAITAGANEPIQFPVGLLQLEFHVGVTKDVTAKGGVKFWVVELGAEGSYTQESIQKVVINLEPPTDREGRPIRIHGGSDQEPH